jgi:FKBP-type peptidyl-prolyl cis-trans isomerase (trigger factor)
MNITKENIDDLNAVLKVKIEKTDYEEKVETVLKDYRKKATIKGFRPGMVPIGLIKKMYGRAVQKTFRNIWLTKNWKSLEIRYQKLMNRIKLISKLNRILPFHLNLD